MPIQITDNVLSSVEIEFIHRVSHGEKLDIDFSSKGELTARYAEG